MADSKSLVLTMPDEIKASYDAMIAKSEPGPDFATHMAFIQGTLRASEQNAMAAEHALAVPNMRWLVGKRVEGLQSRMAENLRGKTAGGATSVGTTERNQEKRQG